MSIMVKYFGCFSVYFFYGNYFVHLCIYSNGWLFMCIYINGWLFMLIFNKCVKLWVYFLTVFLKRAKRLII